MLDKTDSDKEMKMMQLNHEVRDAGQPAMPSRRRFMAGIIAASSQLFLPSFGNSFSKEQSLRLRIAPSEIEVARGQWVRTTAYNAAAPGPLIRMKEGEPLRVAVENASAAEEYVHWHGFALDASLDGTAEEGSLAVAPGAQLLYMVPPQESGSYYVHSHAMAHRNLHAGAYSGQFAFVYVERRNEPGDYDREFFLTSHEWEPAFYNQPEEDKREEEMHHLRVDQDDEGDEAEGCWEIRYRWATLNGRTLGFGEPLRVRQGERVLLHLLNASATESVQFALPGHTFEVRALDGRPVPNRIAVPTLDLGVGERIDAIVEMNAPGVWVLGATDSAQRSIGLGVVVEYAGCHGDPVWTDMPAPEWDYSLFASTKAVAADQELMLHIVRGMPDQSGFERWSFATNERSGEPIQLLRGVRYRLHLDNRSNESHPIHLHRHSFELTRFRGREISGLLKDTVVVPPYQRVSVDVTPQLTGPALFHCHNQLHMDTGFQTLLHVQ